MWRLLLSNDWFRIQTTETFFTFFFFLLFLKNSFWFRWSVIPMRYHTQWYNYVFRFVVRLKKKSHRSPIASLRTPSFFSYWCAAVYVCLLLINLHGWPWIVRLICLYCQHFHKKNFTHSHSQLKYYKNHWRIKIVAYTCTIMKMKFIPNTDNIVKESNATISCMCCLSYPLSAQLIY